MTYQIEQAEPYLFPGSRTGCLMVHGFTGAPNEVRPLGEHLASRGYTVLGVRLAGHGTTMDDLIRMREQDWIASVEDGYNILRGICDRIYILGLSLGGVLTLHAAAHLDVAGIVVMSAPYETTQKTIAALRPIVPLLSKVWRSTPKRKPRVPGKSGKLLNYPAMPIRSFAEIDDMIKLMRASLKKVTAPALVIHSKADRSVPVDHAPLILAGLGSEDKDLLILEKNSHVVTRGEGQSLVFEACEAFLQRIEEEKA